ncbi:MAG: hypothetical protein KBD29_03765 [Candidatus Magasanikbacteria bacterium]|jgi:hypothetical protein|nr:hypothetical protein [Candidatus Magasanikbacteria bacterium]
MASPERLSDFPRGIQLCLPTEKPEMYGDIEYGGFSCGNKNLPELSSMRLTGHNSTFGLRDTTYVFDQNGLLKLDKKEMDGYKRQQTIYLLCVERNTSLEERPLPTVRLMVPKHRFILESPMYRGDPELPPDDIDFAEDWQIPGQPTSERIGFATLAEPEFLSLVEFQFSFSRPIPQNLRPAIQDF